MKTYFNRQNFMKITANAALSRLIKYHLSDDTNDNSNTNYRPEI